MWRNPHSRSLSAFKMQVLAIAHPISPVSLRLSLSLSLSPSLHQNFLTIRARDQHVLPFDVILSKMIGLCHTIFSHQKIELISLNGYKA
jgi:hypothetical protein